MSVIDQYDSSDHYILLYWTTYFNIHGNEMEMCERLKSY